MVEGSSKPTRAVREQKERRERIRRKSRDESWNEKRVRKGRAIEAAGL
jgi:hypothetical protein